MSVRLHLDMPAKVKFSVNDYFKLTEDETQDSVSAQTSVYNVYNFAALVLNCNQVETVILQHDKLTPDIARTFNTLPVCFALCVVCFVLHLLLFVFHFDLILL